LRNGSHKVGAVTLVCLGALVTCGKDPVPTRQASEHIDVMADPHQYLLETDTSITIKVKNGTFTFTFVAEYSLSGVVVCKQRFSGGWAAEISPYDLTFSWGKITEDYVRTHITFSHSGRWYHYRYSGECPVSKKYIIEHTSNSHIVPANENVQRAVGRIRTDTPVLLYGYLIDIDGIYKDAPYWWYTSRTRTDTGAHSCEVFYVTCVQIGYDIYE
jgi:hypothetical protein